MNKDLNCKDCKVRLTNENRPRGFTLTLMERLPKIRVCAKCNEKYRDLNLEAISNKLNKVFNQII